MVLNNSDNVKMRLGSQSVKKNYRIPLLITHSQELTIKKKKDEIDNRNDKS